MLNSKASCLCGCVKIIARQINPKFSVCHCDSCQTWGGAPFFALHCGTDLKIEGSEKVKVYKSSSWACRGFCIECGTHLFYRLNKTGEYNLPVGLFKNLHGLKMDMQYYIDQRPNYYCFCNKTQEMTQAEIEEYIATHF